MAEYNRANVTPFRCIRISNESTNKLDVKVTNLNPLSNHTVHVHVSIIAQKATIQDMNIVLKVPSTIDNKT